MNKRLEQRIELYIGIENNILYIKDEEQFRDIIKFELSDDIETDLAFINFKIGEYVEKVIKNKMNDE